MAVFVFHVPLKETDISCNSNFLSLPPSYVNTVHKIKTFPACKFNHVRSPTDSRQWLPIESAKHFCLRVILRWLISLAAPALAGRCIGRMSCGPGPQQTPWLCPASGLGQDHCDHKFPKAVLSSLCPEPARSALCFVRACSRADRGMLGGHCCCCCMAKSPASCSVLPTCWNSLVIWSGSISALARRRLSQLL